MSLKAEAFDAWRLDGGPPPHPFTHDLEAELELERLIRDSGRNVFGDLPEHRINPNKPFDLEGQPHRDYDPILCRDLEAEREQRELGRALLPPFRYRRRAWAVRMEYEDRRP